MKLDRRAFLKLSSAGGISLLHPPADATPGALNYAIPADEQSTYFAPAQRKQLSRLADHIFPGAGALGAARYIERLLTAFDFNPPPIFADAQGGFLSLDRGQELAWRMRIFGTNESHDGVSPPLRGLRGQIGDILASGTEWSNLTIEQQQILTELTVQSVLADPIYGGNLNGEGWWLIHFPGPSLPQGYSGAELSELDAVVDANPVDWMTMLFLRMRGI
jgi:hypothetical protein